MPSPPLVRAKIINYDDPCSFQPYQEDEADAYLENTMVADRTLYVLNHLQRTRTTGMDFDSLDLTIKSLWWCQPEAVKHSIALEPGNGVSVNKATVGQPHWFSQSPEDFEKTLDTKPELDRDNKEYLLWVVDAGSPTHQHYVTIMVHFGPSDPSNQDLRDQVMRYTIIDPLRDDGWLERVTRVESRLKSLLPELRFPVMLTPTYVPSMPPGDNWSSGFRAYDFIEQIFDRIAHCHAPAYAYGFDTEPFEQPARAWINVDKIRTDMIGLVAADALKKTLWKTRLGLFPVRPIKDGDRDVVDSAQFGFMEESAVEFEWPRGSPLHDQGEFEYPKEEELAPISEGGSLFGDDEDQKDDLNTNDEGQMPMKTEGEMQRRSISGDHEDKDATLRQIFSISPTVESNELSVIVESDSSGQRVVPLPSPSTKSESETGMKSSSDSSNGGVPLYSPSTKLDLGNDVTSTESEHNTSKTSSNDDSDERIRLRSLPNRPEPGVPTTIESKQTDRQIPSSDRIIEGGQLRSPSRIPETGYSPISTKPEPDIVIILSSDESDGGDVQHLPSRMLNSGDSPISSKPNALSPSTRFLPPLSPPPTGGLTFPPFPPGPPSSPAQPIPRDLMPTEAKASSPFVASDPPSPAVRSIHDRPTLELTRSLGAIDRSGVQDPPEGPPESTPSPSEPPSRLPGPQYCQCLSVCPCKKNHDRRLDMYKERKQQDIEQAQNSVGSLEELLEILQATEEEIGTTVLEEENWESLQGAREELQATFEEAEACIAVALQDLHRVQDVYDFDLHIEVQGELRLREIYEDLRERVDDTRDALFETRSTITKLRYLQADDYVGESARRGNIEHRIREGLDEPAVEVEQQDYDHRLTDVAEPGAHIHPIQVLIPTKDRATQIKEDQVEEAQVSHNGVQAPTEFKNSWNTDKARDYEGKTKIEKDKANAGHVNDDKKERKLQSKKRKSRDDEGDDSDGESDYKGPVSGKRRVLRTGGRSHLTAASEHYTYTRTRSGAKRGGGA